MVTEAIADARVSSVNYAEVVKHFIHAGKGCHLPAVNHFYNFRLRHLEPGSHKPTRV
ncbi:hypothetical protein [Sphingobium chungbukense]|uniref:hypothetical protein n=1 Tax=Sphingobium chungbukense TaxID=56193 RepID=UPI000AC58226